MILIVDDKRENILSLKKILEINDFKVETALSGEEALLKILKNNYFLIILDVQMPGMDGFEVAEAISGTSKTKDIPIIFLSAVNVEKKFITKGYASGAIDYITKPFDPDILILKVKTFYRLYTQTQALNEIQNSLREEIEVRKAVQLQLKERNRELQSILESIPQIAFTAKPDGNLEFVNEHWYEYSYEATEFPKVKDGEDSIRSRWLQAIENDSPVEFEVCIFRRDTEICRWQLLRAIPISEGNELVKWVGTFTDIQEQRSALDKKDEFISIASHELKTPLTSIKAYVHMLHTAIKEDAKEQASMFIDRTEKQIDKLYILIADLLDISKIESGKLKFNMNWFPFQNLLNNAIETIQQTYPRSRIKITGNPDMTVFADEMRIEQVLINYLSNAIKYSPENDNVEVNVSLTDKKLHVAIRDFGIGISEDNKMHIFKKFYRSEASSNRFQGLGIGLYICSEIIKRHGGEFGVDSTPGEGSVFFFSIPVSPQPDTVKQ